MAAASSSAPVVVRAIFWQKRRLGDGAFRIHMLRLPWYVALGLSLYCLLHMGLAVWASRYEAEGLREHVLGRFWEARL